MAAYLIELSLDSMQNVAEEPHNADVATARDAKGAEIVPRRLLWQRILAPRNLWGTIAGALSALIVCPMATLLFWKLGIYGRFVAVIWSGNNEKAAWHGALIGFLVGWFGKSLKSFTLSCLLGGALLTFYDYQNLRAGFALTSNSFDSNITVHALLFSFVIGTLVYLVLKNYGQTKISTKIQRAQR